MKKRKLGVLLSVLTVSTLGISSLKAVNAVDYLALAQNALWQVAKYASSSWFNRKPSIKKGSNYVTSGTGDLKFNEEIGASVKVNINLGKSKLEVDAFAQTDFLNWFDKIAVTLTAPNGGKDVINRSVTHNQHSYYNSASPYGTYTLRFTDTDKCKWDCYYTLTDFSKAKSVSHYQNIYNEDGLRVKSVYNASNKKSYIIADGDASLRKSAPNKVLSADELNNQFYDEHKKIFVNALKDYDIGDKVMFSDVISEVEYNEKDNYTLFTFKTEDSNIHWPFAGDLTSHYKKGDTLNLNLKVVEEYRYADNIFENLDYCMDGMRLQEKNAFPNIYDYQ